MALLWVGLLGPVCSCYVDGLAALSLLMLRHLRLSLVAVMRLVFVVVGDWADMPVLVSVLVVAAVDATYLETRSGDVVPVLACW